MVHPNAGRVSFHCFQFNHHEPNFYDESLIFQALYAPGTPPPALTRFSLGYLRRGQQDTTSPGSGI